MVYRSINNYDYLYSRQKMFWTTVFTMLFLCVIFTISSKTFSADPLTGEAYAEFDSSTGVLRIFRDTEGTYTNEQISGTKTYYTELETITDRTNPKWYSNRANITSVIIESEFTPKTAYNMFAQCTNLTNITGLSNLDTSQVTNMTSMFNDCSSLTSLDLSNFDTTKVEEMSDMFSNCSSLASLNISSFSTSDALDMESIFKDTTLLKVLYLGTDFKFAGNTMLTGNWRRDGDATIYTADNLMTNYNGSTMSGTYRRILDEETYAESDSSKGVLKNSRDRAGTYKLAPTGEAYAEFDSSTGVLRIFRDTAGAYTDGQTSGTKTYYAGIESVSGTNNPKWYSNNANITSVIIEDEFIPLTAYYMFGGCTNLTSITGMSNLNTSQVTNMSYMFRGCSSLTSINLNDLNTSNVTNMTGMFYECTNLTSLNLSNFDTGNLIDMTSMFLGCTGLTSLDLSNFNTNKVTTMLMLFFSCTGLTSLDISSFNTSSVTSMMYMFAGCTSLTSLDLSNFDTTTKNTITLSMFNQTDALRALKLGPQFAFNSNMGPGLKGNWRRDGDTTVYTANGLVTNYDGSTMSGTYRRIPDGEAYAEFDSSTGILRIFRDTAGTYTNGQTSGTKTYYTGLESITGNTNPKWYSNRASITSVVIEDEFMPLTAYYMFYGCTNLTSITGISNLNTSQVTTMQYMFRNCSSLTTLDLSSLNTSNVTTMYFMFRDCSNLTTLNLSNFNTSQVTTISYMFYNCRSLTSLNLSSFNTSQVTTMSSMFYNCSSLTSLNLSNFNTSNVTTMLSMFSGCSSLTFLNLSNFNTSQVTDMQTMFYGCSSLTSLNLSNFNTGNVTNISSMFWNCSNLTTLNLSNFNTSQVTTMGSMFRNCTNLTNINISSFNTSQVTTMLNMFEATTSLKTLSLGSNFSFVGTNQGLIGNWRRDGDTIFYTAANLISNYDGSTMAGTYREIGEAYAELDSSTGVMRIFRDDAGAYTDGQTIGTKVYLTGIESITDASPKWYYAGSFITSVIIEDEFMPLTASNMFCNYTKLTSITGISNLNTSQVTNMEGMFYYCESLTSLDLSSFDTSNVTNMVSMFGYCDNLASLNLSNFNTSNVTTMTYMFQECDSLTSLNLSNFNTSQVTKMVYMFYGCNGLTSLNLSSFNTSQVTDMPNMFYGTDSLKVLSLGANFSFVGTNQGLTGNWRREGDTTVYTAANLVANYNGSTMAGTYRRSEAYAEFDSSTGVLKIFRDDAGAYTNGQTSGTKTYYTGIESITGNANPRWYSNRTSITSVVIEDTFMPRTAYTMFYGCTNLTSITGLSNMDTSQVANMSYMFSNCSNLTNLNLSNFNTGNVTNMSLMFSNTSSLKTLSLGSNFDFVGTDQALSGNWRRDGDTTNYTAANLVASYDGSTMAGTYRMTEAYAEFDSSTGVLRIFRDDAGAYTNGQTSGTKTYYTGIESITGNTDPKWSPKRSSILSIVIEDEFKPLTAYKMFASCYKLTSITGLSNLDTSQVTTMQNMFYDCNKLTSLDLSSFDTSQVTTMYNMFYNCRSLISLNLSSFDTSNVTTMYSMFNYCTSLTNINVSSFNTSNVTNMDFMFLNCNSLTSLDISSFDTSQVTGMHEMLNDLTSLNELVLGSNFSFLGTTAYLNYYWRRDGDTIKYSANDLMTNYNGSTMAGTYRRIEAYAEFDSSTGVLRIFRDNPNAYTDGETSGTKTYYAGIESVTGGSYPKWYSNRTSITSVVIEDAFAPLTAYYMFYGCTNLTSITCLANLVTSNVTTMYSMFYDCSSLTSLDLSSFDTSRVTDMSIMFYSCESLTNLDLSSFDTSQVTSMTDIFDSMTNLDTLKLGTDWNFLSGNGLSKSWLRDGDTTMYTAYQLANAYDGSTMSGTYRAYQELNITETVKGGLADTSKEFDFTINVTNGGVAIDSTHAYTGTKSGNLVFNNGIATFTLKHNDSISTYLPYGVSYTITQDSDGYTLTKTNDTGTLTFDKTAAFTDTLNGIVPTGISSNSYILYLVLFITSITALIIFPYLVYRKKKAK